MVCHFSVQVVPCERGIVGSQWVFNVAISACWEIVQKPVSLEHCLTIARLQTGLDLDMFVM
uniref:Uncharacterized protein n=1 Tax=Arundo donax TaxID=35708 RepID=A0A0A9CYL1_ARUDO